VRLKPEGRGERDEGRKKVLEEEKMNTASPYIRFLMRKGSS
jgi:hypothetical protein